MVISTVWLVRHCEEIMAVNKLSVEGLRVFSMRTGPVLPLISALVLHIHPV